MSERPTCVDLFCGAGGFSLGFQEAGFEVLCGTDYHETALKTFQHNLSKPVIQRDIQNLEPEELLDHGGFDASDVNVIIGGPPCQGFSTAGPFNPDDPRNSLFHHYLKIVDTLNPDAIVMENVPGILYMEGGGYKRQVLEETHQRGYNTQPLRLNAADYGVPQLRERVIFLGFKDGQEVQHPPRTHTGQIGQRRLTHYTVEDQPQLDSYISVQDAISDLSFLGPGEKSTKYERETESVFQEQMRGSKTVLHNHQAPNHSEKIQERFRELAPGQKMKDLDPSYQTEKHTMMRMDPSLPCNTVTTLPEDFVHYSQERIPTVRELARIQSFPDGFKFLGPRTTGGPRRREALPQYSQVGNAVPPRLAEAIANHLQVVVWGKEFTSARNRA